MADLRDGRYEGDNGEIFLELRADLTGDGVVSGDVFVTGGGSPDHLASFRTDPGVVARPGEQVWAAVWQAFGGVIVRGELTVTPFAGDPEAATVKFRLEQPLNGLPFGVPQVAVVRWAGERFRRLAIETETEQGVVAPLPVDLHGAPVTFVDCLQRAGFDVSAAGQETRIPRQADGWEWNESNVHGVLDVLMAQKAQADLSKPAWQVHLLMLSHPVRKGLYGVMFDVAGTRPRQGCAVFVDEIRDQFPEAEHDRQIIHTMAHEVGHALNLAHRFEPSVGRENSTSIMNYPRLYEGGDREVEFWQEFGYCYDADELTFLRHGARSAVMPGTAPFHSVDYWSAAPGARAAHVPARPTAGFELTLDPPPRGPVFDFGQPIFLQVSLCNTGRVPVRLPAGVLDVKAGCLEVLIERNPVPGEPPSGSAQAFEPMIHRCLDLTPGPRPLAPGKVITDNISLSFGASGFTMAEPGSYRLTPMLSITQRFGRPGTLVIRGRPLTVRVAYPKNRPDEELAIRLFEPEIGTFLALGGSSALTGAQDRLNEIRDERKGGDGDTDAVAATITRALGIYAGHSHLEYRGDRFVVREAQPDAARDLLGGLVADQAAMECFDRSTARRTAELASGFEGQDKPGQDKPGQDKPG